MKQIKLTATVLVVVIVTSFLFSSWGYTRVAAHQANVPQTNLKIALLAPLSGPIPEFGLSAENAALLAVEDWNTKTGKVLGRTVELVVKDTQCNNPTVATDKANEVVSEGIQYIVGEICSSASIPVSVVAEANQIIQISPSSTAPQVTVDGSTVKEYVFRACFIDPFQGSMMAQFADQQHLEKAFVLQNDDNDYSKGLSAAFQTAFEAAGGSVELAAYHHDTTDFTPQIDQILVSHADVVYIPDFSDKVNIFAAQARQKGVTAAFMGGDGWDTSDLNYDALEGSYFSTHFSASDPRPVVQQWVARYHAEYGKDPDAIATLTYDATNLLLNAIQNAGVDDPDVVKEYMSALTFDAVSGMITFDEQHNPFKPIVVEQIQNHQPVFYTSFAPFGSISGHIFKSDGSVIQDAQIMVQAYQVSTQPNTAETIVLQSDGSYLLGGLTPGKYKLLANSAGAADYVEEYYNNKLNLDLANPVFVYAGGAVSNVNFYLETPVSAIVTTTQDANLVFTPAQGENTEIFIPKEAVSATTTLTYSPASADTGSGFIFAGTAFNLSAYQNGTLQEGFHFDAPIEITLPYPANLGSPTEEADLKLYYWNKTSGAWEDALCQGYSITRNSQAQTLTIPVCHLSSFALLREGYLTFLPVVKR